MTFQFSIATAAYTQLQRKTKARWAQIPLLGGGTALHHVGTNNDIITLNGVVYPELAQEVQNATGIRQFDTIIQNAQRGAGQVANTAALINRIINSSTIADINRTAQAISGQVGTEAIDELRDLLYDGLPLLLQSAEGLNLGYWVILELDNADSNHIRNIPRKQQFKLTIQYYGETAQ